LNALRALVRWLACLAVAGLALQLFFIGRIALMVVVDPQSTTFQRSEAWKIATQGRVNTTAGPAARRAAAAPAGGPAGVRRPGPRSGCPTTASPTPSSAP
jgi:monofunctional biosynthetic peptidoglycan transglycosylase